MFFIVLRKLLYTTLIIAILCVISILVCNRTIKKHTVSKLYTEVNTIPSNNVGLLLGTSPKLKNGNNNLYFDYRILATVELYKAGKIKYILISGDNRKEDYNEPEEMKKALIQKGIPEKFIYLDYAGFRTLDSVVRAQNVNAYAGLKTNIRELLARVKMFIDLGMDKQPHFLGEKIIIGNNK